MCYCSVLNQHVTITSLLLYLWLSLWSCEIEILLCYNCCNTLDRAYGKMQMNWILIVFHYECPVWCTWLSWIVFCFYHSHVLFYNCSKHLQHKHSAAVAEKSMKPFKRKHAAAKQQQVKTELLDWARKTYKGISCGSSFGCGAVWQCIMHQGLTNRFSHWSKWALVQTSHQTDFNAQSI